MSKHLFLALSTLISLSTLQTASAESLDRPDGESEVVREDTRAARTSAVAASTCTAFSYDWGSKNNTWNLTFNSSLVSKTSKVFVEACEIGSNSECFVGDAKYTIYSVAPGTGKVTVKVNIAWDSPLATRLNYLVCN